MSNIKEPPDPNEFAMEIKKIIEDLPDDQEERHINLDLYICEVMEKLGYKEGIRLFRTTPKGYV